MRALVALSVVAVSLAACGQAVVTNTSGQADNGAQRLSGELGGLLRNSQRASTNPDAQNAGPAEAEQGIENEVAAVEETTTTPTPTPAPAATPAPTPAPRPVRTTSVQPQRVQNNAGTNALNRRARRQAEAEANYARRNTYRPQPQRYQDPKPDEY